MPVRLPAPRADVAGATGAPRRACRIVTAQAGGRGRHGWHGLEGQAK
jgi:hypothetical protein